MAATIFAAWWTQAQLVWTVCLRLYPTAVEINLKTICKVKLDISPPGYAPSHLRPFTSMHHFSLRPATNTHYFFYRTLPPSHLVNVTDTETRKLSSVAEFKKANKNWFVTAASLDGSKNKFQNSDWSSTAIFYQPCKLGKDRSGRCWDNRSGRNR